MRGRRHHERRVARAGLRCANRRGGPGILALHGSRLPSLSGPRTAPHARTTRWWHAHRLARTARVLRGCVPRETGSVPLPVSRQPAPRRRCGSHLTHAAPTRNRQERRVAWTRLRCVIHRAARELTPALFRTVHGPTCAADSTARTHEPPTAHAPVRPDGAPVATSFHVKHGTGERRPRRLHRFFRTLRSRTAPAAVARTGRHACGCPSPTAASRPSFHVHDQGSTVRREPSHRGLRPPLT